MKVQGQCLLFCCYTSKELNWFCLENMQYPPPLPAPIPSCTCPHSQYPEVGFGVRLVSGTHTHSVVCCVWPAWGHSLHSTKANQCESYFFFFFLNHCAFTTTSFQLLSVKMFNVGRKICYLSFFLSLFCSDVSTVSLHVLETTLFTCWSIISVGNTAVHSDMDLSPSPVAL